MAPATTTPVVAPPPDARRRRRLRRVRRAFVLALAAGLVLTGGVFGVVAFLGLVEARGPFIERCETDLGDGGVTSLAPDQADNAALFAAVAVHRDLPARAVTIAIATAKQESKLRNIDFGDRDSLGLFQQRPSQGWGTAEQVMDPVYATNAFYDVLVTVEEYQDLQVTAAAQEVQRSAFPEAYAEHEQTARAFASALTGHSPVALTCLLRAASQDPEVVADAVTARLQRDFVEVAATRTDDGAVLVDGASLAPGASGADSGAAGDGPASEEAAEALRLGWAVAQWAVATADATGARTVVTDGMIWDRAEGVRAHWSPAPTDGQDLGVGQVLVR